MFLALDKAIVCMLTQPDTDNDHLSGCVETQSMNACSPLSLDSGERNIDKLFMDKSKLAFKVQFFHMATAESAPAPSSVIVRKHCWYTAKG